MNTHDDLLDNDEMSSFYEDDIENMCSNKEYDTCGSRNTACQGAIAGVGERHGKRTLWKVSFCGSFISLAWQ